MFDARAEASPYGLQGGEEPLPVWLVGDDAEEGARFRQRYNRQGESEDRFLAAQECGGYPWVMTALAYLNR